MIPSWVIWTIDGAGAAALLVALVLILACSHGLPKRTRLVLAALVGIAMVTSVGNVLEWTGVMPEAEQAEDFFLPLLPSLWLFLFVVELERADRDLLRVSYDRMTAVHQLASRLTIRMDPQAIMAEVADTAVRLLDISAVAILTPEADGQHLRVRAFRGLPAEQGAALRVRLGEGLAGKAFRDRRPYATDRPEQDMALSAAPFAQQGRITNAIAVPLVSRGEALGSLTAARTGNMPFRDTEVALLETLSTHAAAALESARLFERVAESEAKYRVLVENAQAAIIVVDAQRNVLFWNRGAERLFGWTEQETVGRHISLIYPQDQREAVSRVILEPLRRDGLWAGEYTCARKDGSIFTAFLNLSRVTDLRGETLSIIGILTDVTERTRLRDQLFQAQKMETIGALAGGIAHDFNNLLTAILGFGNLLRLALPQGSEEYESAASIEQAAERGTHMVRQLLAFSHRQPDRREPVDLNRVVHETADLIGRTFPKNVTLVTCLEPHLRTIQGDPNQMHQVLMNLTVNARDTMAAGGSLTLTTENVDLETDDPVAEGLKAGPCIALTVTDTGHGIPAENQPHIFEPFFTTKSASGGTGLGLSTVFAIVNRHGGRITFTTAMGEGTSFRILLPAAPAPDTAPAARSAPTA